MKQSIFDIKEWKPAKGDETITRLLRKRDKNTKTEGL